MESLLKSFNESCKNEKDLDKLISSFMNYTHMQEYEFRKKIEIHRKCEEFVSDLVCTLELTDIYEKICEKLTEIFELNNCSIFIREMGDNNEWEFKKIYSTRKELNINIKKLPCYDKIMKRDLNFSILDEENLRFFSDFTGSGVIIRLVDKTLTKENDYLQNNLSYSVNDLGFVILEKHSRDLLTEDFNNCYQMFSLFISKYIVLVSSLYKISQTTLNKSKEVLLDNLTSCFNKSFLEKLIESGIDLKKYFLVLCDIDYFKQINDNYSHQAGDYVLKFVGTYFRQFVDKMSNKELQGYAIRDGGDEFTFLIPKTEKNLEEIKNFFKTLTNSNCVYNNKNIPLSFSIGIGSCDENIEFKKFKEFTDYLLYETKEKGRNGVTYNNFSEEFLTQKRLQNAEKEIDKNKKR